MTGWLDLVTDNISDVPTLVVEITKAHDKLCKEKIKVAVEALEIKHKKEIKKYKDAEYIHKLTIEGLRDKLKLRSIYG
jgi:hypothetical protein